MESEAAAVPGYVNRPAGHAVERREPHAGAGRETGRRSRMRTWRVSLLAYEQRAERRSRMRTWLLARAATGAGRESLPRV